MKNRDDALVWMRRGESSLAQMDAGMENAGILLEDRCVCAQQSAEKAL